MGFSISDLFKSVSPDERADALAMAASNKNVFDAHVEVGFTEDQAMAVVLQIISTHLQTSMMLDHTEASED